MKSLLFYSFLLCFFACISPPQYADTPSLEFRSFSKAFLNQGINQEDSITLVLFFTDGDGDFGEAAQSNVKNIFIKDNRTGNTFNEYKAPFVPVQGSTNGISGTISIKVYSTCCTFPASSGIPPCETSLEFPSNDLTLDIHITDRAGNLSNTITTPILKLQCN
jgi:hypothetical protein